MLLRSNPHNVHWIMLVSVHCAVTDRRVRVDYTVSREYALHDYSSVCHVQRFIRVCTVQLFVRMHIIPCRLIHIIMSTCLVHRGSLRVHPQCTMIYTVQLFAVLCASTVYSDLHCRIVCCVL